MDTTNTFLALGVSREKNLGRRACLARNGVAYRYSLWLDLAEPPSLAAPSFRSDFFMRTEKVYSGS